VTATSMMDAITGLSAFLLFNSLFIFVCIPPFRVHKNDKAGLTFKSYELRHHISRRSLRKRYVATDPHMCRFSSTISTGRQ
jgi:hypothetical protein